MPCDVVAISAIAGAGALGTAFDLRARRVPNPLTFGVALTGLVFADEHLTMLSPGAALAGLLFGLLLMLPGHVFGATGAGDVKLFAALGTLLGPTHVLPAFAYTAIAGGGLAVAAAVRRRRLHHSLQGVVAIVATGGANAAALNHASASNRFAYAPAIAFGTLAAALGL